LFLRYYFKNNGDFSLNLEKGASLLKTQEQADPFACFKYLLYNTRITEVIDI